MDNFLLKIHNAQQTVFTTDEIAILTGEKNKGNLKSKLSYYVKKENLIRIRRGFFAKNSNYERKELVTKLYKPSYISFETVLREEGVIFQHYEEIFSASYLSRYIEINENKVTYRKLKNNILLNQSGVANKKNYFQATKERAFLDMVYLFGDYYFDNLSSINWDKCFEIVNIYKNEQLKKRLKNYFEKYAE